MGSIAISGARLRVNDREVQRNGPFQRTYLAEGDSWMDMSAWNQGSLPEYLARDFNRDGKKILGKRRPDPAAYPDANHDIMLEFLNNKDGAEWASLPVAVIYTKDLRELHRYIEYPAIYHKDRVRGFQQAARPGESDEQRRDRDRREFLGIQASPFFDIWASAAIDEVLTALHERRVLAGGAAS